MQAQQQAADPPPPAAAEDPPPPAADSDSADSDSADSDSANTDAADPAGTEPASPDAAASNPSAGAEPGSASGVDPNAATTPPVSTGALPDQPASAEPAPPVQVQPLPENQLQPEPQPATSATSGMVLSEPPKGELGSDAGGSGSSSSNDRRQFGARLDIGFPEVAVASFVYRPFDMLRGNLGMGYNGVSPGLKLGVDFLPLGWGPALSIAYGHYFEGNANNLIRSISGSQDNAEILDRFGYDYVNFRLGMEFGGDRFVFFTRAGASYLRSSVHNLDQMLEAESDAQNGNTTIEVTKSPVLSAWLASVNLGFIVRL